MQNKTSGCSKECRGIKTQEDGTTAKISECSAIETSISPMPYTFRVSAPNPRKATCPNQQTKAPPFYLQLDHTLAVLWCLFRKQANICVGEECELGVGQLQWALYFLKGIKTPSGGDRAEDVSLAIQTVQDALLDLYADMASVMTQPCPSTMTVPSCSTCESIRKNFADSFPWMPKSAVPLCDKCHSLMYGDQNENDTEEDSDECDQIEICISSPQVPVSPKRTVCGLQVSETHLQKCPKALISEEIKELKKLAVEFAKRSTFQPSVTRTSTAETTDQMNKKRINSIG